MKITEVKMNKNLIKQINKTVIVYQWQQNNLLKTFYIASYYKNHQYKKKKYKSQDWD